MFGYNSTLLFGPSLGAAQLKATGVGTFRGGMWGGFAAYEYARDRGLYAYPVVRAATGHLKMSDSSSSMRNTQVNYGTRLGYVYTFGKNNSFQIVPYTGYFGTWIEQKQSIEGFSPFTYTFDMPYIPVGAQLAYTFTRHISLKGLYQYQIDILPRLKISVLDGAYWELSRRGDQYAELTLTLQRCRKYALQLTSYVQTSNTGSSKAVTAQGMPLGVQAQDYIEYGGRLAATISF